MAPDGPQGDSTPAKYNLIRDPQQSIFSELQREVQKQQRSAYTGLLKNTWKTHSFFRCSQSRCVTKVYNVGTHYDTGVRNCGHFLNKTFNNLHTSRNFSRIYILDYPHHVMTFLFINNARKDFCLTCLEIQWLIKKIREKYFNGTWFSIKNIHTRSYSPEVYNYNKYFRWYRQLSLATRSDQWWQ
jgi:hypothetical protein